MVTDRLDRALANIDLQAIDHAEIEQALHAVLMACADLTLDEEVIALQRMVLQETGNSSDIAGMFYRNGIQRIAAALADWLRAQQKRGLIELDDVDEAAGMLLGMLASAPRRAAMFGRVPLPSRRRSKRGCAAARRYSCGVPGKRRWHAAGPGQVKQEFSRFYQPTWNDIGCRWFFMLPSFESAQPDEANRKCRNAHDFGAAIYLPRQNHGPLPTTKGSPHGERNYWIVSEAEIDGERIRASLAAPGSDRMNASGDGFWRPDVRAPFLTDDGETVLMHYTGLVEQTPAFNRR